MKATALNNAPMNFYLKIGGFIGVLSDFWINHYENILLTFILGFVGALGGAAAKALMKKISKK